MTIGILATGDEIIHGDTLNTNGQKIAQALSSEGLPLGFHLACSDKEKDIIDCLDFLTKQHDIIIIIGGLGPTTDDLTRFALAHFTGDPLVQHQEALNHIEQRLLGTKVVLNAGNLQQSLFPNTAVILPNPNGSAVGCYYQWENITYILLPGPPRECLPMFDNYALQRLKHTHHSNKQIIKWLIFGLAESEIAQTLEDALKDVDCQTGYRLDTPYVEFKVRCKKEWVERIHRIIDPIIAPHTITVNNEKASKTLYYQILQQHESITIIDEATGGLLETKLCKPNSKPIIRFNSLQQSGLTFHITGLDEYWMGEPAQGLTQLTINYSNGVESGTETQTIPYRSALVVEYAAEWLSFRLSHLINQLHQ